MVIFKEAIMTIQNFFVKLEDVSYLSHLLTRSPAVFKGLWIRPHGILKLLPFRDISETKLYYYQVSRNKLFILNKMGKTIF